MSWAAAGPRPCSAPSTTTPSASPRPSASTGRSRGATTLRSWSRPAWQPAPPASTSPPTWSSCASTRSTARPRPSAGAARCRPPSGASASGPARTPADVGRSTSRSPSAPSNASWPTASPRCRPARSPGPRAWASSAPARPASPAPTTSHCRDAEHGLRGAARAGRHGRGRHPRLPTAATGAPCGGGPRRDPRGRDPLQPALRRGRRSTTCSPGLRRASSSPWAPTSRPAWGAKARTQATRASCRVSSSCGRSPSDVSRSRARPCW